MTSLGLRRLQTAWSWIKRPRPTAKAIVRGASRAGRFAADTPWIPIIVIVFAVRAYLASAVVPLGTYDEGLLLTDSFLMNEGRVIYRDFYVNYPPGVFQLVRAILALDLPPIWTVRSLGLCVRVASAICAGLLVRKVRGKTGVCTWTVATTLVLQVGLGVALYAYPLAVLLALSALLVWPDQHSNRVASIASGVLLAAVSYVRHDLFIFVVLGMSAVEAISWLALRRSFFTASWSELKRLALAVAIPVVVLWLPVLLSSGFSRALHDLVLDQARLTMPGRLLPIPPLLDSMKIGALNTTLPAFLGERTRVCIVLAFLGAGACGLAFVKTLLIDGPLVSAKTRLFALLTIFALATFPQGLQRTDYWHIAYGIPLTIAALTAGMGSHAGVVQPLLVVALLTWFTERIGFATLDDIRATWSNRDDARFVMPHRQAVIDFVRHETRADEPLFVGCESHRRTLVSPVDLLYLTRRTNATRYVQFDPGTVTGAEGQQQMIADLERTRPKLALRDPYCAWDEPNRSMIPGATVLDEYLAKHYAHEGYVGGLSVWRRRAPSP